MRIFLYEYTCAEGADRSLHAEGRAMLSAVLEDFGRLPSVEGVALVSDRSVSDASQKRQVPGWTLLRSVANRMPALFRDLARTSDYTLLIAPEFDDLLLTRCRWVEEVGGRLLGPSADAVALTGDKLALDRHLRRHGVPTPPCQPLESGRSAVFPAVCKPRHGAGSQATFLVRDHAELRACVAAARAEGWRGELLVQPFVPGQPASVAFLCGPRGATPLRPATQELSDDGRFRYRGGTVPLPGVRGERAVRLARRAIEVVPGLRGYVGVDLVLGDAADGSDDWVLEINPRLTTSYVGLRALARTNLAEAWLCIVDGEEAHIAWRPGVVRFQADGTLC